MSASERIRLADGRVVQVAIRRSPRARRIQIRVAPVGGAIELVLPPGAARAEGLAFLGHKAGWIAERSARSYARVPFAEGETIPFLGGELILRAAGASRGASHGAGGPAARREGATLYVSGRADLARAVEAWLRRAARDEIEPRVGEKAARLGKRPGRIALRDTVSRWGSCSAGGNLSFSWRLVMAPPAVLDYVVAHEVAHLAERNHGERFWAHVARLCEDPQAARAWLGRNGAGLHRYG